MNCKYCNSEIKLNVPHEWGDVCEICRESLRDYAKAALTGILSDNSNLKMFKSPKNFQNSRCHAISREKYPTKQDEDRPPLWLRQTT
jgi:hypothetical protein